MDNVNLTVNGGAPIPLHVRDGDSIGLLFGSESYQVVTPEYEGTYEADALFIEQVFKTKNKRMAQDFSVHAINYTEAPNDSGVTVTIGG